MKITITNPPLPPPEGKLVSDFKQGAVLKIVSPLIKGNNYILLKTQDGAVQLDNGRYADDAWYGSLYEEVDTELLVKLRP